VSCYLRHITDILDEAGIAITPANRKQIDEVIHLTVGIAYKNCPAAWKKFKEDVRYDREKRHNLVEQLQKAIS